MQDEDVGDFLTALEQLHPTIKRNIGGIQEIQGLPGLAEAIAMEKPIAVSDASTGSRFRAAHAYIIESRYESFRIVGIAHIDCDVDDLESTRAELWGQLAIHTMIDVLYDIYNINSGSVDVFCDNKYALVLQPIKCGKMAFPRFFRPNVDINIEIQTHHQKCTPKITINPIHTKGHQDDNENFIYEQAAQPVRRNIDMDDLSRKFLQTDQGPLEPRYKQQVLPTQKASLTVGSTLVHNNIHHHVNLHFFGSKLEKRFLEKIEIKAKYQNMIQWQVLERAYKGTARPNKLSIFNLLHNKWATNMVQASWDADKSPDWNRCCEQAETFQHIYACASEHASKVLKKAKTTSINDMRKANTAPLINSAIITLLEEYRKGYQRPLRQNPFHSIDQHNLIKEIMDHQRRMRLDFFVRGYISSRWEVAQNIYLGEKDFNTPATNWTTKIIKGIWKFSASLWTAHNDFVHGKEKGKKTSARRKEILERINVELERTAAHMEFETKKLRSNAKKSIGNALVPALEVWLRMLRNVKGEVFQKKPYENIRPTRAQPITIFLVRRTGT